MVAGRDLDADDIVPDAIGPDEESVIFAGTDPPRGIVTCEEELLELGCGPRGVVSCEDDARASGCGPVTCDWSGCGPVTCDWSGCGPVEPGGAVGGLLRGGGGAVGGLVRGCAIACGPLGGLDVGGPVDVADDAPRWAPDDCVGTGGGAVDGFPRASVGELVGPVGGFARTVGCEPVGPVGGFARTVGCAPVGFRVGIGGGAVGGFPRAAGCAPFVGFAVTVDGVPRALAGAAGVGAVAGGVLRLAGVVGGTSAGAVGAAGADAGSSTVQPEARSAIRSLVSSPSRRRGRSSSGTRTR